jgi:hypothetical protein
MPDIGTGGAAIEGTSILLDGVTSLPSLNERIRKGGLLVRKLASRGRVEPGRRRPRELTRTFGIALGFFVFAASLKQAGQGEERLYIRWVDTDCFTKLVERAVEVTAPLLDHPDHIMHVGEANSVCDESAQTLKRSGVFAAVERSAAVQQNFTLARDRTEIDTPRDFGRCFRARLRLAGALSPWWGVLREGIRRRLAPLLWSGGGVRRR